MDLLTLDYETYYADDYSLSNMTTEAYVRDSRFEVILCAVKVNDTPAFWLLPERLQVFLAEEVDWAETTMLSQHAHFDGFILSHHYNRRPAFHLDTLSMARIIDGPKMKNGLEFLAPRHGFGMKGHALHWAKGKHRADFSRDELPAYGAYSCNDAELEYHLAQKFLPQVTELQLKLIDLKIRMFTEPAFMGNVALLDEAVHSEATRKAALLARCGYDQKQFGSSEQFADILRAHGAEPGMKVR